MKRFVLGLIMVLAIAAATACTTPAAAGAPSPTVADAAATSADATATPAPQAADTEKKDYGQIGADLMNTESIGTVRLKMTESELIGALGQPDSESDATVWGSDGLKHSDWTYQAKGLTVNMAESSNPESEYTVFSILAKAPCDLATQKGVRVGDSKDAVLAAYGFAVEDPSEDGTKDRIVAGTEFGGLIFAMKDGKVESIFMGASAE